MTSYQIRQLAKEFDVPLSTNLIRFARFMLAKGQLDERRVCAAFVSQYAEADDVATDIADGIHHKLLAE